MNSRHNFRQTVSIAGLAFCLVAAVGSIASAQGKTKAEPPAPVAEAPAKPSNAPYMKPMGRLSTILGSVHFLRSLCGDTHADVWRQKMADILDAQSPGEADRRILIAQFNQGYRSFESTYRKCTPAATVAMERYAKEGANLSREISARYGN